MGRNSYDKVASCESCPNVPIKYLHLEGLSKAPLVKFEAVDNIINIISAGRGQCPEYLHTIYNYIQKNLKASTNT